MSTSDRSPTVVPDVGRAVFLVLDDFGSLGRAWREADEEDTDFEAVLSNFLTRQYRGPVQVVGFNAIKGWSMDVSAIVAQAIRRTCGEQGEELPEFLQGFVHRHDPEGVNQLQLPLRHFT